MWLYKGLLFFLVLLAGCGFQLRGAVTVPPEMARTYIETQDRHSLFYRKLRESFRRSGVLMTDSPADATSTFTILADDTGQRVLSVSARNVPREFEVYYTVLYQLQTANRTLIPARDQTLTRDYTWDETLVLGKEREESMLREAIADDLVRVVMMQLSGI
jgi:LPS-assembly lipoprotein